MLSAGIAGPVSYVTLTGDWTPVRQPRATHAQGVVGYTFLGLLVGLIVPELFGTQLFIGRGVQRGRQLRARACSGGARVAADPA